MEVIRANISARRWLSCEKNAGQRAPLRRCFDFKVSLEKHARMTRPTLLSVLLIPEHSCTTFSAIARTSTPLTFSSSTTSTAIPLSREACGRAPNQKGNFPSLSTDSYDLPSHYRPTLVAIFTTTLSASHIRGDSKPVPVSPDPGHARGGHGAGL